MEEREIRRRIENLTVSITGQIEHGECFYDKEMLDELFADMEKFKVLARKRYELNKAEMEDE